VNLITTKEGKNVRELKGKIETDSAGILKTPEEVGGLEYGTSSKGGTCLSTGEG